MRADSCGSPGRAWLDRTFSRRAFVGAAALTTCGLAFGLGADPAAAATVQVWGLDPVAGHRGCSCAGCSACRAHAANKLFATSAAADSLRAHFGCKCAVVQLGRVEPSLYHALFAGGLSIDRRYAWVQAALDRSSTPALPDAPASDPVDVPPVAIVNAAPAVTPGSASAAPKFTPPIRSLTAALRTIHVQTMGRNKRTLLAEIVVDRAVTASMTLRRSNAVVASRVVQLAGAQIVGLPLPAGLAAGAALLEIRLRDRTGRTKLLTKSVRIPAVAIPAVAHLRLGAARRPAGGGEAGVRGAGLRAVE